MFSHDDRGRFLTDSYFLRYNTLMVIPLLWLVFIGALILSAVIGLILAYHWKRFSANPVIGFFTIIGYAVGCLIFLGTMFASIVAFA